MAKVSEALSGLKIEVYSARWCPDCTRFKTWLEGEGVEYEYVDIESTDGAATKLENETGKRAIPFALINGEGWVRGYHKELPLRFDPDLFLKEVGEVVAAKS